MAYVYTLAASGRLEIEKIKGSRFIATVAPAATIADAQSLVAVARAEIPEATHHCWAWRGLGRDDYRSSDDGEPSGSAGRPILKAIDGRRLTSVAVVVSRHFGGTKLGTGGLVRAYGAAAARALDAMGRVCTPITVDVILSFAYELLGPVQGLLTSYGLQPASADYGERVRLRVPAPEELADAFVTELLERTSRKVSVERA